MFTLLALQNSSLLELLLLCADSTKAEGICCRSLNVTMIQAFIEAGMSYLKQTQSNNGNY